jgi:hypothetical protein
LPETAQNKVPSPGQISEVDAVSSITTNSQERLHDAPKHEKPVSEWEQEKASREAERIKRIEDSFNEDSWVKPGSPWGFSVY